MENLKRITEALKGSIITKFYRTQNPISTFWHGDGLGELRWYEFIVEIENQGKYNLEEAEIKKWDNNQKIIELESYKEIRKSKIIDLIFDEEHKGIYLKLHNNYIIYHDTSLGSELVVEQYDKVFDESGRVK